MLEILNTLVLMFISLTKSVTLGILFSPPAYCNLIFFDLAKLIQGSMLEACSKYDITTSLPFFKSGFKPLIAIFKDSVAPEVKTISSGSALKNFAISVLASAICKLSFLVTFESVL
jgi:hypothetical protein